MNLAARINALTKGIEAKAAEYAAMVRDGSLTAEEAAQCLAGAALKLREKLEAPGRGPGIEYYQLLIDQRLPGFKGLVIGRHV